MNTVAVDDETDKTIEELQDELPWSPSKKDIVAKAVEEFRDKKAQEGQL